MSFKCFKRIDWFVVFALLISSTPSFSTEKALSHDALISKLSSIESEQRRANVTGDYQGYFENILKFNDLVFENYQHFTPREVVNFYKVHATNVFHLKNPDYLKKYFERYYYKVRNSEIAYSEEGIRTSMGMLLNPEPMAIAVFKDDQKAFSQFCDQKRAEYDLVKNRISYSIRELQRGILYLCHEKAPDPALEQLIFKESLADKSDSMSPRSIQYLNQMTKFWFSVVYGMDTWSLFDDLKIFDKDWHLVKDFDDKSFRLNDPKRIFASYANYRSRLFLNYQGKMTDSELEFVDSYLFMKTQSESNITPSVNMGGNLINIDNLVQLNSMLDYLEFLLKAGKADKFEVLFLSYLDQYQKFAHSKILDSNESIFDMLKPLQLRFVDLYIKKTKAFGPTQQGMNAISVLVSAMKNLEQNFDALLYKAVHTFGSEEDKTRLIYLFHLDRQLSALGAFTREQYLQKYAQPLSERSLFKKQLVKKYSGQIQELINADQSRFFNGDHSIKVPEGMVYLNYFSLGDNVGQEKAHLIVHYADRPTKVIDLGARERFQKLFSELMKNDIYSHNPSSNLLELSRLLLPDNLDLDGIKTLAISPLAGFSNLPFEVLNFNKRYLVESFDIYYSGSLNFRNDSLSLNKQEQVAIFSNPSYQPETPLDNGLSLATESRAIQNTFNDFRSYRFAPLVETELESELIKSKLLEHSDAISEFKEQGATDQKFMQIRSPKVLHVASHGFAISLDKNLDQKPDSLPKSSSYFVLDRPIEIAGLAFSFADLNRSIDNTTDDGIVDFFELGAMDLSETDLMVLSSCETALGFEKEGYLFEGLRKALALSGVNHTVTTAIKIPSDDTVEFMDSFYQKLAETTYVRAISETKRKMIRQGKKMESWAPFLLSVN